MKRTRDFHFCEKDFDFGAKQYGDGTTGKGTTSVVPHNA